MASDSEVIKLLEKQRNISKRGLSSQYNNTVKCQAAYDADEMNYEDRIQFEDTEGRRRRATVNFNKIQGNVESVIGFEAQNRRQAKYVARPGGDKPQQVYSKNMNALYSYTRDHANADQIETEMDADKYICGIAASETDLSYIIGNSTTLPNGEIVKIKLDPRRLGWDPASKEKNLLNADWAFYFDEYELNKALSLFQSSKESDFDPVPDEDNDRGYVYNPWGGLYDKIKTEDSVEWTAKEQDMVRVYTHQWVEYETIYKSYNPMYVVTTPEDAMFIKIKLEHIASQVEKVGPEGMEVDGLFKLDPMAETLVFDETTKGMMVKEFGPLIQPINFKRKVYWTAVYSGKHIFTKFRSISQQGFSIKFKTGIYNNTAKMWIGMVNSMIEPQKYYNKALTEFMFTIASNSKGGYFIEEDAVEDVNDFESKIAKTNAVIRVRSGALSSQKIQPKATGVVPTGLDSLIQLSDAAISAAGVDPSFLGQVDNEDQSGIMYKRRIRQVISKMARYFDSSTLYQKEDARLCADLIPVWVENNNGEWIRITGADGADEFMQISEDMLAAEYDVTIQEAAQTVEDKAQTSSILGSMGDKLAPLNPTAAMGFYAESLQGLSIDGDVRNRLIQLLQPQQQPQIDPAMVQQMQQRIQELESDANQAMVENTKAQTEFTKARIAQTQINNEAVKSKMPLTHAQTAKTLEEAARTAAEAEIAQNTPHDKTSVVV